MATVIPLRRGKPSIAQLRCTKCGATTDAACNCGATYVTAREYAAQIAEANPDLSNRAIAAATGVDEGTVRNARKSGAEKSAPEKRTGRDGKSYPAKGKTKTTAPNSQPTAREQVAEVFRAAGSKGMTVDQVREALPHLHSHTVASAADTLKNQGFLLDTGNRVATRSGGGRKAAIYQFRTNPAPDHDASSDDEAGDLATYEHDLDPKNYYKAFLLRADQAAEFAFYTQPITRKRKREIVTLARRVAAKWNAFADQIEKGKK